MTTGHAAPGHRRLRVGACLPLSGRFARFGRQAARGLDVWRSLDGTADLIVEDDRSDPRTLGGVLPGGRRAVRRAARPLLDEIDARGRPAGVQVGHQTVLVRWTAAGPVPGWAGDQYPGTRPA